MSRILDADESSASSSDSEGEESQASPTVSSFCKAAFLRRMCGNENKKTAEEKSAPADFFFIDVNGANKTPPAESEKVPTAAPTVMPWARSAKQKKSKPLINMIVRDRDDVEKILSKAVLQPDYDWRAVEDVAAKSFNQQKKQRKLEREKTAGRSWGEMPATELTDERRRDLELLLMRGALDPRSHYRKMDRDTLPKYFQMGEIVENKADYYASRLTKKQRKRTMVEELMEDVETVAKTKRKYTEIQLRRTALKRLGASFAPGAMKCVKHKNKNSKKH